jgi:molybdopterin-guanine dinucleotide biosynthesis protein A
MTTVFPLTAIVLAGGRSSRMGRDKLLIPIQGVPLLRRVCDRAIQSAATVYVVTAGEEYDLIVPEDCRIIREPVPTRGPLIAFSLALPSVETEWVLVLAGDLPFLTVEVLREWAMMLDKVPEEAIAFLPYTDDRWQSLCGFYRRSSLESLRKFIAGGGSSFQKWLGGSIVREIPVRDPRVLFNCNTPEDLEKMLLS